MAGATMIKYKKRFGLQTYYKMVYKIETRCHGKGKLKCAQSYPMKPVFAILMPF